MVRINISLDTEATDMLRELADKENRPVSKQIKHMMEFYIEHKNTMK